MKDERAVNEARVGRVARRWVRGNVQPFLSVPRAYSTVVVDPPWKHGNPGWWGGAQRHYERVRVEDLYRLPIPALVCPDAHLWLWSTEEHLHHALELVNHWGFDRAAVFPWLKLTKRPLKENAAVRRRAEGEHLVTYHGRLHARAWGMGHHGRVVSEYLILGVQGEDLTSSAARQIRRHIVAPVRKHSEKPEESYDLIRSYSPAPALELFARQQRPGFEVWGHGVYGQRIPVLDAWSASVRSV